MILQLAAFAIVSTQIWAAALAAEPVPTFVYVQTFAGDPKVAIARSHARAQGQAFELVDGTSLKRDGDANLQSHLISRLTQLGKRARLTTLALSGHSDGSSISDVHGTVSFDALRSHFESRASCDEIPQSLVLWGCNTNRGIEVQQWFEPGSNKGCLKSVSGYLGRAPTVARRESAPAFRELLANQESLVAHATSRDEAAWEKQIRGIRAFDSVSLAIAADLGGHTRYAYENERGQLSIVGLDEVCKDLDGPSLSALFETYETFKHKGVLEKNGVAFDPSDVGAENPLRTLYSIAHKFAHCESFKLKASFRNMNPSRASDEIAAMLFQENIKRSFFTKYLPSRVSKDELDTAVATLPEGVIKTLATELRDRPAALARMPRKSLLEANAALQKVLMEDPTPSGEPLASTLRKIWLPMGPVLTSPATTCFSWIEWEQANTPVSRLEVAPQCL